jgi:hypothetical protein
MPLLMTADGWIMAWSRKILPMTATACRVDIDGEHLGDTLGDIDRKLRNIPVFACPCPGSSTILQRARGAAANLEHDMHLPVFPKAD